MEDIVNHLKEMGLTNYEAKVYLSLLKNSPSTGYEVSKNSGVPQSRAYDALKSLEGKQIVVSTGEKPITYIPVPANELLGRYEKSFKDSLDFLKENLNSISKNSIDPILNIRGPESIFKYANEIINNAKKEIFLEIWNEDVKKIKDSLKNADKRGIIIKIVGYNDVKVDFGCIYQHGLGRTLENSLGGYC